jgi:nitrite reductase/ring-hydroxylating ferredoxin subunit
MQHASAGFPSLPLVGKMVNDEKGLKTYPVRVEDGRVEVEV